MDDSVVPTYSISLLLQRTTREVAYVIVPVTMDLVINHPDGTIQIDSAKMVRRAIELGHEASVAWQCEDQQIQPNFIQSPPPHVRITNT
jgi:hypothetical protein